MRRTGPNNTARPLSRDRPQFRRLAEETRRSDLDFLVGVIGEGLGTRRTSRMLRAPSSELSAKAPGSKAGLGPLHSLFANRECTIEGDGIEASRRLRHPENRCGQVSPSHLLQARTGVGNERL